MSKNDKDNLRNYRLYFRHLNDNDKKIEQLEKELRNSKEKKKSYVTKLIRLNKDLDHLRNDYNYSFSISKLKSKNYYNGTISRRGHNPKSFTLGSPQLIEKTKGLFIGNIQQQPPLFSALKKDGKRLYEYARAGETTAIAKRNITISKFEITRIELPDLDFLIRCSKGTYIRSIAHDFGKSIASGAHLSALQRTQSGSFELKDAYTIESALNYNSDINIKSK